MPCFTQMWPARCHVSLRCGLRPDAMFHSDVAFDPALLDMSTVYSRLYSLDLHVLFTFFPKERERERERERENFKVLFVLSHSIIHIPVFMFVMMKQQCPQEVYPSARIRNKRNLVRIKRRTHQLPHTNTYITRYCNTCINK